MMTREAHEVFKTDHNAKEAPPKRGSPRSHGVYCCLLSLLGLPCGGFWLPGWPLVSLSCLAAGCCGRSPPPCPVVEGWLALGVPCCPGPTFWLAGCCCDVELLFWPAEGWEPCPALPAF